MFFAIVFSGTMPLYLKIATVNCRGIRDRAKRLAFFTYAKTLDVHVLCLQETYSKPQDESIWQIDWGDKNQAVFNSNAEISRKTDAGTAILLNYLNLQFGNIKGKQWRQDIDRRNTMRKLRFSGGQCLCLYFLFQTKMGRILQSDL